MREFGDFTIYNPEYHLDTYLRLTVKAVKANIVIIVCKIRSVRRTWL